MCRSSRRTLEKSSCWGQKHTVDTYSPTPMRDRWSQHLRPHSVHIIWLPRVLPVLERSEEMVRRQQAGYVRTSVILGEFGEFRINIQCISLRRRCARMWNFAPVARTSLGFTALAHSVADRWLWHAGSSEQSLGVGRCHRDDTYRLAALACRSVRAVAWCWPVSP